LHALNAIAQADYILYDALVDQSCLKLARAEAVLEFAGKRPGHNSPKQHEITTRLIELARNNKKVVRLKGGDPFVFGRGGEELDHVRQFGIQTAVVPGISSSVGLTGLQQIPLTYRGLSESFWVVTGSTSDGRLSADLYTAVRTDATVVVLMGFAKLPQIVDLYQEHGRGKLPIALIQNGSLPNERIALGTVDTILEQAARNQIGVPAVIVLGEVVAKHEAFDGLKMLEFADLEMG